MIKDAYGNTQEFKYDPAGNAVTLKDQKGNITKLKYDENNRLSEKRIPTEEIGSGNHYYYIEKYVYDETGNLLSQIITGTKEPMSKRVTNYTYYPNGLLQETVRSSGSNIKYRYDKNGNLTGTESLRENGIYDITKYEYDNENKMTASIQLADEDNILTEDIDNITELRDSENSGKIMIITGYEYDLLGNKTKTIYPKAYSYPESDGERRTEYTEEYSYDTLNRLERIDRQYNGKEVSIKYFYDEAGNKNKEINERGDEIIYAYDSMNRLIAMTDALKKTYTYEYDPVGNKTRETNPKGDTISYNYDKLNRITKTIDPYGKVINKKVYDEKGNIIKDIEAKGYLAGNTDGDRYGTEYKHDLAGRIIKIIDPEGGITKYEYNQFGELIQHTDALGNASQYEYDGEGRLIKVTDPLGISTKYTWDKAGNKLTITDGRSKITKYSYGSFGMLATYTDADQQETKYKHDLTLTVASMIDRNGKETKYSYDNKGLLTEKKVTETEDEISYTYDALGNKETMTDTTGTSIYKYNENNWLISIEKDGELQLNYAYDQIGNITNITDRQGNTTKYTYDKSGRMETVNFDGRTITYEYDENGNRKNISYDGETEENYTYDKNNRLLELINKKAGGSIISSYNYTYDKAGRQTSKEDGYGRTEYTYDKIGRMQKVETPGKTTVYAYDGAGNRISQDETYTSEQTIAAIEGTGISEINYIIKRSEYIYGNTNTLLKLSEKMKNEAGAELLQKITTFRYDKNGNEQRRTVEYITLYNKENPKAYEAAVYNEDTTKPIHAVVDQTVNNYDGFNRLIKTEIIKMGVRTTVEYTYNGDGLRIEKTIKRSDKENTAKTTNYLYDRQHVILEERENDEIKYVRGINYIARIDDTGKLSYYLYNGHGDVVQTINENGQTENQYDYDIFGNPTLTIEEYENNIRYAGEFYDAETGLYYLRARYYDPYIGRFISEDSYWGEDINPLSLNLYTYCYNDPIKYIDPTGHIVSAWDEKHLTKAEQDKIQKYTNDWEAAYKVGNKKGMEDAHASAEKIRDGKRSENEIGTGDGNTITIGFGGNSSNSTSSGTSSSSGKSGGSSGNDAAKQQVEQARLKAEAQIAEILKDNEKAKDLINLIKAKEISYDAAIQAGKNSEAELYAQGAQILLQKLKEQTEKEKNKTLAENLLSIGDKGDAVKDLQKLLIGAGIYKVEINGKTRYLEEDGDFGKITQAAVKVYQEKKGLTVDGIAGPQTLKSLIGSNYNKYAEILDKMQFGKGQYNNDKEEAQRLANTMGTGNAQNLEERLEALIEAEGWLRWPERTNEEIYYINMSPRSDGIIAGMYGTSNLIDIDYWYPLPEQKDMFYEGTMASSAAAMIVFGFASMGDVVKNDKSYIVEVAAGAGKTFGPMNPGPLADDVARTFSGGTYTQKVLTQDTTFYRVHGGDAGKVGSFMSRTPQNGAMQSQIDLALNPAWGNSAISVTKVTVPKGTVIYEGSAASQSINGGAGSLLGGGNQIYRPKGALNSSWFGK